MANETSFLQFWRLLNEELRKTGHPELTFGPANRLWLATVARACRAVRPLLLSTNS